MESFLGENFFFVINFLVGISFVISGLILWKNPPKKINDFYGYRSKRSMSSQDRWDFAQVYSGKLMTQLGLLLVVVSMLEFIIDMTSNMKFGFSLILILSIIAFLFLITENKLKNIS